MTSSVASLKKELVALKKVNKSLKKTAYTLINEGNESNLSDEDGSNNFLSDMSMICEANGTDNNLAMPRKKVHSST